MDKQYWTDRWTTGRTGWHEGKPNALLEKHAAKLGKARRILVPLAGAAYDLQWLADQGHDVVGVELVQDGIDAFFKGKNATPHKLGAHEAYYADGVTLVKADIFDVSAATLGRFEVIYDRAALVALEPSTRARYVEICQAICSGPIFLVTFEGREGGPPFPITGAEIKALYGNVEHLDTIADQSAYLVTK